MRGCFPRWFPPFITYYYCLLAVTAAGTHAPIQAERRIAIVATEQLEPRQTRSVTGRI